MFSLDLNLRAFGIHVSYLVAALTSGSWDIQPPFPHTAGKTYMWPFKLKEKQVREISSCKKYIQAFTFSRIRHFFHKNIK